MVRVAVVGEDDDAVAAFLEANGGINDQALGAANAQVRVEEDDGTLVLLAFILKLVSEPLLGPSLGGGSLASHGDGR